MIVSHSYRSIYLVQGTRRRNVPGKIHQPKMLIQILILIQDKTDLGHMSVS